jgi:hypothetical protein
MRKKKKHLSSQRRSIDDRVGPSMFLRLCHRCLYLNEGTQSIDKCHKCESRFSEVRGFEKDFNPSADFDSQEHPIQEILNDFDSEQSGTAEKHAEEDSDESDGISEQEKETRKRSRPISGLSVLW